MGNRVNNDKIDDKDVNLLNNTKQISFRVGFLTFKAKLAFI